MTNPALLSPPPFPLQSRDVVDRSTQRHLRSLYLELRRGQVKGATDVALSVARALRRVISGAKFTALEDLYAAVRFTGAWLQDARRGEQAISNVTLRALHVLAEEARALIAEANESGMDSMTSSQVFSPASPGSPTTAAGPSSAASPTPGTPVRAADENVVRPQYRRADSTFFGHGSTFSISDLVAAGQNAHSLPGSSGWNSAIGSGTTTPAAALSRAVSSYGDVSFGSAALSLQKHSQGRSGATDDDDDDDNDVTPKSGVDDNDEDDEDDDDEDDDTQEHRLGGGARTREDSLHLKPLLLQAVEELIDELDSTRSNIARDARDHIHSGEVVLTIGYSRTIEAFLKQASRDRSFTLIVADSGSSSKAADKFSASLSKSLRILAIPHSSVFTLLPRITKVLVSAHTVLANGGLLASPGCAAALLAAKVHSTPVLVLAGLHKVCSDWRWVGLASPTSSTMPISSGSSITTTTESLTSTTIALAAASQGQAPSSSHPASAVASPLAGDALPRPPQSVLVPTLSSSVSTVREVILNEFDYVEPDNVDVLITNTGEYPVSYVYRLISENFAPIV